MHHDVYKSLYEHRKIIDNREDQLVMHLWLFKKQKEEKLEEEEFKELEDAFTESVTKQLSKEFEAAPMLTGILGTLVFCAVIWYKFLRPKRK